MARLRHLVVVVPGIGGSVLKTAGGSLVWGHGLGALAGALVDPSRLSLAEHPSLRPVGLLPSVRVLPWMVVPGYDDLVRQLINTFGLGNDDVDIACDQGMRKPGASLVLFPYDFRLGVPSAARRLAAEIRLRLEDLTEDARHQRVIIIAHSLGGLVARFWLGSLNGASCCKALITLGTPHRGAPKALDWLLNGIRVGPGPVSVVTSHLLASAAAVVQEWASTYDLLPRYRAVRDDKTGIDYYPHELSAVAGQAFVKQADAAFAMHREIETAWDSLE
ncbi:MAG: lipase/acyltransferase domain-containing protein, partial [Pseudonocardiaceae bacterium]